jgi:hypothetical protein
MIEIVFSESACGSLKLVQGDPQIVYGFSLALSIGDISERVPGVKRKQVLEWLYSVYPNDVGHAAASEQLQPINDMVKTVCSRVWAGEAIRIWYSDNPDEICGLYWFVALLHQRDQSCGQIYVVKLPEWTSHKNGNIVRRNSWSEVAPEEWRAYLSLQKTCPPMFRQYCISHWQKLREENSSLRVLLNGQVRSVSETFYDDFIVREIEKEDIVFSEAMIVGRILGEYQLGISDAWVALRIEEMIRAGKLEIVTESAADHPVYHRKLKKVPF